SPSPSGGALSGRHAARAPFGGGGGRRGGLPLGRSGSLASRRRDLLGGERLLRRGVGGVGLVELLVLFLLVLLVFERFVGGELDHVGRRLDCLHGRGRLGRNRS